MRHLEGVLIAIVYLIFISYAYSGIRFSFPKYDTIEVNKAISYYIIQHKYLEVEEFIQYLKQNPSVVFIKIDGSLVYSTRNPESYTTVNFVFYNSTGWVEVIVGVKS